MMSRMPRQSAIPDTSVIEVFFGFDYKRARTELKKRSTDTLRLQKKARKGGKGGELQRKVESCLQDVTERRYILEETEKRAVRAALIEERSRFCVFVAFLKPVVDEEVAMLSELSHLQEVVDQLEKHTADPYTLPPASEQVIADLKSTDNNWTFTTPPSSPSSLGSRKSSMCSISSLNSSSSGSSKSHHSPNHHYWHRSLSQRPTPPGTLRLSSVSSQDSGFTSQDVLYPRPQVSNMCEHSGGSNASTPVGTNNGALPNPTATWPNLQETLQFERAATAIMNERPHTISTGTPSTAITDKLDALRAVTQELIECEEEGSNGKNLCDKEGLVPHTDGAAAFDRYLEQHATATLADIMLMTRWRNDVSSNRLSSVR
ncbi:hypothetical protein J6590_044788 [Homalodisca vitripennis]|nr:hypothetical protein J6590_044788 [Homalodisca vitripennis]